MTTIKNMSYLVVNELLTTMNCESLMKCMITAAFTFAGIALVVITKGMN